MKLNELFNQINIKLMKRIKNSLLYVKKYITNRMYLEKKPSDLNLTDKCIAYCFELPFGIISFFGYVDIARMYIISSMVEINEYKLEKTDELNGLDEKLRPRTIKNRFLERLNRIKINKKKKDK